MSVQALASTSASFHLPSTPLHPENFVQLAVIQATAAIVQSWIVSSYGRPSEEQVLQMIAAVQAELSKSSGR